MKYEKSQLLMPIEQLRRELNHVAQGKSLTDPEVIKLSQSLDQLLNDYQKELLKIRD